MVHKAKSKKISWFEKKRKSISLNQSIQFFDAFLYKYYMLIFQLFFNCFNFYFHKYGLGRRHRRTFNSKKDEFKLLIGILLDYHIPTGILTKIYFYQNTWANLATYILLGLQKLFKRLILKNIFFYFWLGISVSDDIKNIVLFNFVMHASDSIWNSIKPSINCQYNVF